MTPRLNKRISPLPRLFLLSPFNACRESSASQDRLPTGAREYGSAPRGRHALPRQTCSPSEAFHFNHLITPEGILALKPPNTADAKLEAEASQLQQQEGSSPRPTQRQQQDESSHYQERATITGDHS